MVPSISVSEDTYRRIEDRAKPFEDSSPEDVLRRLLDKTEAEKSGTGGGSSPADLVSKGGRIPHGSELRMRYKGREYRAVVDDGKIIWEGKSYSSPSKAAVAVIQSTGSDRTTADGWRYWEVKTPESGEWRLADEVRADSQGFPDRNGQKSPMEKAKESVNKLSEEEKEKVKEMLDLGDD